MSEMFEYQLTANNIKDMLDSLAADDTHIARAIELVGYPSERRREAGFEALIRIIIGQQLSVKAAASISARVDNLLGEISAERFLAQSEEDLRACGLSFQKIKYGNALCKAVHDGALQPTEMQGHDDKKVLTDITAIKGFGRWSAEMYLMFSLGRSNIWPSGDLAVRAGIGRILGMPDRPNEKETDAIGERWHPYRSVVALLSWHYYSNAPL